MDYEELEQLARQEILQREEEGYDIGDAERDLACPSKILVDLSRVPQRADFSYMEPSDLAEIRAQTPERTREIDLDITDQELLDRIHGGWLGRCAGCLLGKPVEGLNREQIEEWLRIADAYPLNNYFPHISELPRGSPDWLRKRLENMEVLRGHISRMVRDDDIDYTIMGLSVLETSGFDFSASDVGEAWLTHLPYLKVYTAERAAYRNLVNGLVPPETATYMNPYREWIGAQIRADIWGYVTPGRPELGAELAFRDASLSHTKNGIYGEMFVSAMISSAFAKDNIEEIIGLGLAEIPRKSRLAEAIRDLLSWSKQYKDWKDAWNRVMEKYGHYHRVHSINNTALALLGLLYGEGNYERSITIGVMAGLDTDCNGATVGSIVGTIVGADSLPEKWTAPLNNRVQSSLSSFNDCRISDLARRTFSLAKSAA